MYVENGWLSLDPIYLSLLHATRILGQFPRTWMDFKMADTSERRVFCNTILLKYHVQIFTFDELALSKGSRNNSYKFTLVQRIKIIISIVH